MKTGERVRIKPDTSHDAQGNVIVPLVGTLTRMDGDTATVSCSVLGREMLIACDVSEIESE